MTTKSFAIFFLPFALAAACDRGKAGEQGDATAALPTGGPADAQMPKTAILGATPEASTTSDADASLDGGDAGAKDSATDG